MAKPSFHILLVEDDPNDVNRACDLGANSYLVKPGEFETLTELMKTLDLYWVSFNEKPELEARS